MKFKDKVLQFFGLGYEDEPSEVLKIYQEIAKDKPVIMNDNRTPIEELIDDHDPALKGLSKLKTPGDRLRHLRKARGLTQSELAYLSNVSRSTIGEIENNKWETTSLEAACNLSADLDVHVTDIWTTVLNK